MKALARAVSSGDDLFLVAAGALDPDRLVLGRDLGGEVAACAPDSETSAVQTPTAREASSTCTVVPLYRGAMRERGVHLRVVAPPISSGSLKPCRVISSATVTISSSEGVIRPERPIMSALLSLADFRISWNGTMTPRSMTSKLLHCRTTPTMFLPMSWTSPLTVAMTILPLGRDVAVFSASM